MKKSNKISRFPKKTPGQSFWSKPGAIVLCALLASGLLHLTSFVNIKYISRHIAKSKINMNQPKKVKIRIIEKKKAQTPQDQRKKIVEVKQEKTEAPKDSKYKSFQDHKTKKETKVADRNKRNELANAGKQPAAHKNPKRNVVRKPDVEKQKKPRLEITTGDIAILKRRTKKQKDKYRSLIPSKRDLVNVTDAGYQEYLDDEIDLGDSIDLNTTNYRYMGYFTNMRKAIQLVWNYPSQAARKGMQGVVSVEFVLNKDGSVSRVKVLKSSGYKVLDQAIVEALKLASPFAPLPDDFGDRKHITGSFRYILNSFYAGAH